MDRHVDKRPRWSREALAAQFRPAEPPAEPADVRRLPGVGWTWRCARCHQVATGEPVERAGNRWHCCQ